MRYFRTPPYSHKKMKWLQWRGIEWGRRHLSNRKSPWSALWKKGWNIFVSQKSKKWENKRWRNLGHKIKNRLQFSNTITPAYLCCWSGRRNSRQKDWSKPGGKKTETSGGKEKWNKGNLWEKIVAGHQRITRSQFSNSTTPPYLCCWAQIRQSR